MIELNDENFLSTIEGQAVCLVDFYASWCGSCRMSAPMFSRLATEAGVPIYKIEVEKNIKVKEMITLPGLPSVGIFKNGEPVDLINTSKEEAFREFLQKNGLL
ncbi:MAG: thioredoxin domain-containing protein [Bacteriovoracaceae bacterium]|nr:thioredoxin domain-containing protein [Bacteriovoracaceae bacterium]